MSLEGKDSRFPAYVWEAPVRLWHWLMALAMVVLMVTGYFIGSPLPSVGGEAIDSYILGYIRFAHFSAAYVFAILFLGRLYWAFAGNRHAREIFLVPLSMLDVKWWRGYFEVIGYYLFLRGKPEPLLGHNPLAMAATFFMYVLGAVFMMCTGFALYGEGLGMDSWAYTLFSSWVIPLFGQSQDVHTWHHFGMWFLVWFTISHVYIVIREDITSGVTIISSMFNGWRDAKN